MANHKSALKRMRQNEKRRTHNRVIRGSVRKAIKRTRDLAEAGDTAGASEWMQIAVSRIDRAAEKGVLHKNNAARRKSRLAKLLNKTATA